MFLSVAMSVLAALAMASVVRVVIGPTVWDRLMCFNLITSKICMLVVLYAAMTERSYLLDLAITFVLLGFISVIFIANAIQKRGKI